MAKVKKIIAGYKRNFEVENVTFFEGDTVLYSGIYDNFFSTSRNDIYLTMKVNQILKSECQKCLVHNAGGKKNLFIFL